MAKAPKRGSDRADEGQTPAAHQAASPFKTCRSCETRDTCRFEERCDRIIGHAGRPTLYTDSLADMICERISQGEIMRDICAEPDMPDRVTVWRWQKARPDFATRLAHARVEATHAMIERAREVAYQATQDIKIDPERGAVLDGFAVQRAKLIADTEFRAAALINPERYGTKVDLTSGGKPLATRSDDELLARFAMLAAPKPDAATES